MRCGILYLHAYGEICNSTHRLYLLTSLKLEEMGYMPKRKYASGEELRTYANSICSKYGLHSRAMFQSSVKGLEWNSEESQWNVVIAQTPKVANNQAI